MAEPILVVDLGTHASSAAVAVDDRVRLLADPVVGLLRWPSSVFAEADNIVIAGAAEQRRDAAPGRYVPAVRRAIDSGTPVWFGGRQMSGVDLTAVYLRGVAAEAQRVHGGPIRRLTLTVPPAYQAPDARREALLAAAAHAGFPDAELVSDSAAGVLDPLAGLTPLDRSLTLVCDLGATWTVALVEERGTDVIQLAQETSGAGRDFDLLLLRDLRARLPEEVEPLLARTGEAGARGYYQVADLLRRLKHRLSEADQAAEQLPGMSRPYRLTRAELERFAEPALRWLLASCRAVVAQSRATLGDIAAVVLTGGCSRLPAARMMLHAGLGRPVCHAPDPELAAVRGAARWAAGAGRRRLPPERPKWRVEPLSWRIPDGQARLLRWLVPEGQPYAAGALLAQVRAADDRVYDLTADREGVLLEHRLPAGAVLADAMVAATARSTTAVAEARLTLRHHLRAPADWLLPGDRRHLLEIGADGGYVRARDIASGAAVAEVRPRYAGSAAVDGRVCVRPDGRITYLSWDTAGRFVLWDVLTGAALAQFKAPDRPGVVLVDEAGWRLVAESAKRVQVGRYQREAATVWDLTTGAQVEELVGEDLHRRYAGFAARTSADGFGARADSPDGRLRAVAAGTAEGTADGAGGAAAVLVLEAATGQELLRVDGTAGRRGDETVRSVRVGFAADGRHLLAHWNSTAGGWVDVWDV
jgi:hypothetical protein